MKKLQKLQKYQPYHQAKLTSMNQKQIIKQAKFTYSPIGKAFEKHTKIIEEQGKKQVDALKELKPSNKEETQIEAIEDI